MDFQRPPFIRRSAALFFFFCQSQYNGWITVNKMSLVSLVCQLVRQLDTEGLSDLVPHTTPFWGSLIIDFSKENNFASMRQFVFLSIWEIAFERFSSKWDKFSLAWYLGIFFFPSSVSQGRKRNPKTLACCWTCSPLMCFFAVSVMTVSVKLKDQKKDGQRPHGVRSKVTYF